jgi:hypothetical protein
MPNQRVEMAEQDTEVLQVGVGYLGQHLMIDRVGLERSA